MFFTDKNIIVYKLSLDRTVSPMNINVYYICVVFFFLFVVLYILLVFILTDIQQVNYSDIHFIHTVHKDTLWIDHILK